MDSDSRVAEKKKRLLEALERGKSQVHLDARRPGVLVPADHHGNHHLVLDLSYRFDPPDLVINDWGVRQTLSFQGSRFKVGVPWSALYAIASHVTNDFFMYPDDMPKEIVEGAVERLSAIPPELLAEAEGPRAVLREVVLDKPSAPEAKPTEPTEPTPPKRGHLRVVK